MSKINYEYIVNYDHTYQIVFNNHQLLFYLRFGGSFPLPLISEKKVKLLSKLR